MGHWATGGPPTDAEDGDVYEFVRGLIVATCAGAAVVAVAACGSSQAAPPVPPRSTRQAPTTTTSVPPAPTTTDDHGGGGTTDADPAGAAVVPGTITGNHATNIVYDCSTTSRLLIAGSDDTVTLAGTCEQLSITGDANEVRVADVGAIDLTGDRNHVTWGTGSPQVRDTGTANVVAHGAVPGTTATTAPVVPGTVTGSGTFGCSNRVVTVSGHGSTVTLTGTCTAVSVTGTDDTVRVAAVGTITVTGSDDHVTWQSGPSGDAPTVHDSGAHNVIAHG